MPGPQSCSNSKPSLMTNQHHSCHNQLSEPPPALIPASAAPLASIWVLQGSEHMDKYSTDPTITAVWDNKSSSRITAMSQRGCASILVRGSFSDVCYSQETYPLFFIWIWLIKHKFTVFTCFSLKPSFLLTGRVPFFPSFSYILQQ